VRTVVEHAAPPLTASATLAAVRGLTREQRRAFAAAFAGWLLDGFDFTLLTLVLIDLQRSFSIDHAMLGALGTATLVFRVAGGVVGGALADRWGRKLPLLLSILWFSLFTVLTGFSTSYAMLFACRVLFGVGMGAEWAVGMPLALEHLPARLRGLASGILQGAWGWGFILSTLAFQISAPISRAYPNVGWRLLFWCAALPAVVVLWIRSSVTESPVWLERQRATPDARIAADDALRQPDRPASIRAMAHSALLMAAFGFFYYSITFWYPTYLRQRGLALLPYLFMLNVGGIAGAVFWGRLSEGRLGRRGAVVTGAALGVLLTPGYLLSLDPRLLLASALLMAFTANGIWGVVPIFLAERFPTSARALGSGLAYNAGGLAGAFAPSIIGLVHDRGMTLPSAMAIAIAASGAAVGLLMSAGPETKSRALLTAS